MILRTKLEWSAEKKLDPIEKEEIEARMEFDPAYIPDNDLYEDVQKECIIDTDNNLIYVQVEPDKVCIVKLLGGQYLELSIGVQRFEERVFIESNLEEIYKELKEK